jgi:carbonic anhydrase
MKHVHRRNLLRAAGLAGLGALVAGCGTSGGSAPNPTPLIEGPVAGPDEALQRLVDGNKRFVAMQVRHPNESTVRLGEVAKGQKPFAAILSCSDSRVPPELIFDRGLGDVFVVRSAGNIADPVAIGSLEYAVAHLKVSLVMVLGHERCGAVDAALSGEEEPSFITYVVQGVRPAVDSTKDQTGDKLENAVQANVRLQAETLKTKSSLLAQAAASGAIRIVGGRYDLDNGELTLLV